MKRLPLSLLIGDVVIIVLFTAIGREQHGMMSSLEAVLGTAKTAAPYVLGWLLVTPWLGGYRPKAWASLASAATTLLIIFIPGIVAGSLLRALLIGRFSPPIFYAVTAGFLVLMLLAWRLLFAGLLAPRLAVKE